MDFDTAKQFVPGSYLSYMYGKVLAKTFFDAMKKNENDDPSETISNFLFFDGNGIALVLMYGKSADDYNGFNEGDIIKISRPSACEKEQYFRGLSSVTLPYCLKTITPTLIEIAEQHHHQEFETPTTFEAIKEHFNPILKKRSDAEHFFDAFEQEQFDDICVVGK